MLVISTVASPPPCSMSQISAMVPAPTARAGEPKVDERVRRTIKLWMFLERPAPTVNRRKMGSVMR